MAQRGGMLRNLNFTSYPVEGNEKVTDDYLLNVNNGWDIEGTKYGL